MKKDKRIVRALPLNKVDANDFGWSGMNGNMELAMRYLTRVVRAMRKDRQGAIMLSAVKIAHIAELAGIAVALRARAYAYADAGMLDKSYEMRQRGKMDRMQKGKKSDAGI